MHLEKKDKIIITISFYIAISLVLSIVFVGIKNTNYSLPENGTDSWSVVIDPYDKIKCINDDIFVIGDFHDDIYLAKFNSSGSMLWEQTWGTNFTDELNQLCYDSNDSILLVIDSGIGWVSDADQFYPYNVSILKYANSGEIMWFRMLNFSKLHRVDSISLDLNDSLLVAGSEYNNSVSKDFLLKLNKSGKTIWKRDINASYPILKTDSENNIYVFGRDFNENSCLIKYNSSGSKVWQIEVTEYQWFKFIEIDSEDTIFLSGYFPTSNSTQWIMKLNSSGDILNNIQIDSCYSPRFYLSFDKIYIYPEMSADYYPFLLRFDLNLNLEWNISLNEQINSRFGSQVRVGIDSQQNVILLNGNYRSGVVHQEDILVIKFNASNGGFSYFYWGSTLRDIPIEVGIDSQDNLYMICYTEYRNPWNEKISQIFLVKNPKINGGPPIYDWGIDYRDIYIFSLIGFMSLVSLIIVISILKPKLKKNR